MQKKKTEYLVVDATPFIQNAQLHSVGENVVTISEVVEEIRSKRQLRHLASLTYDLQIRDVFPESIIHVSEFAKKTGDYSSLSSTDIKLLALTYQLETEHVGKEHLRESPVMQRHELNAPIKTINSQEIKNNGICLPLKVNSKNENIIKDDHKKKNFDSEEKETEKEKEEDDDDDDDGSAGEQSDSEEEESDSEEILEESSEDDESGWVTPSNIADLKRNMNQGRTEDKNVVVGCMSTDYAVQNVLLQMGLNIVALDGRIITQIRTWILRCYACYKLTTNMKKVFCPKCGNKTLKRVSVFTDKNGNKCININFKKPISTRGKRFSLPMPQGGKHAVNPRLVEDARRPHQKPSKMARIKTQALEPDYIAGTSPFALRDVYSKSAQLGFDKGRAVHKYWMQRNPNEAKRTSKK